MADFIVLLTDVTFLAYFLPATTTIHTHKHEPQSDAVREAGGMEPGVQLHIVLPQLDGLRVHRVQVFPIVLDTDTHIHEMYE